VRGILSKAEARRVVARWIAHLRPGGLVFSAPTWDSWLHTLPIPRQLEVLARCIPEHCFEGRHPRELLVLRKAGGRKVRAPSLLAR
jgi:hypothetical protein